MLSALVFFTLSALAGDPKPTDKDCEALIVTLHRIGYKKSYWEGEEVTSAVRAKLPVPANAKVYKLGEGDEAEVYRVVDGRTTWVLRHHNKDPQYFTVPNYTAPMKFLKDYEKRGADDFRIADVEDLGNGFVKLKNVKGFTLEQLILDLGKDHPQSKRLMELFDKRAKNLALRIESEMGVANVRVTKRDGGDEKTGYYTRWSIGTNLRIPGFAPEEFRTIHPEISLTNVIVNPTTLEMTVVDPR